MSQLSIFVRAEWDEDAGVWVASSKDIDGLSVEAESLELLEPKVTAAIQDLLELNGSAFDSPEIPIHIIAEQTARVPNPAA